MLVSNAFHVLSYYWNIKNRLLTFLSLSLLILLTFTSISHGASFSSYTKILPNYDRCVVKRIIDGDTIVATCIYRQDITVRIVNTDTFESRRIKRAYKQAKNCGVDINKIVELGKSEKTFLKQTIPAGTPILIQLYDRHYGYYGRLLGDIWTIKNGHWVNINALINNYHNTLKQTYCPNN